MDRGTLKIDSATPLFVFIIENGYFSSDTLASESNRIDLTPSMNVTQPELHVVFCRPLPSYSRLVDCSSTVRLLLLRSRGHQSPITSLRCQNLISVPKKQQPHHHLL